MKSDKNLLARRRLLPVRWHVGELPIDAQTSAVPRLRISAPSGPSLLPVRWLAASAPEVQRHRRPASPCLLCRRARELLPSRSSMVSRPPYHVGPCLRSHPAAYSFFSFSRASSAAERILALDHDDINTSHRSVFSCSRPTDKLILDEM
jgi:hypothetical protein